MDESLKKKSVLMIAAGLVSLLVLGIFLTVMQTGLSLREQKQDIQEKLGQMEALLADADCSAAETQASYDEVYQAKADSLAFMAGHLADFDDSDSQMEEYRKLLNVTNLLILDDEGHTLAKAWVSPADFTRDRYNQLRQVFHSSEAPEAFEVEMDGRRFRYYGSRIDYETMAVIEQDPEELTQLLEDTSTWKSILSNVNVGLNGFAFAVSDRDYTFLYHPDEALTGTDALSAGISVAELEDGNDAWMEINGRNYYCGVTHLEDAYIICAVSEEEIMASRNITVGIVLFVFFAVMTIVIAYAILMMRDEAENGGQKTADSRAVGKYRCNKRIGRKIGTIAGIGLLCLLGISFYMQTLFSLSRYSMSNEQRAGEVEKTIGRYDEDIRLITEQYNRRYLNKARTASYILGKEPELVNREDLGKLSRVLGVDTIGVFDPTGVMISTNAAYSKFRISSSPEEQSYEFRKLLNGAEYVIQEAQPDELSGEYRQYIGAALLGEDGESNGFVQISVTPSKLEAALQNTGIDSVLDGVRVGTRGFAFAVSKEDQAFAYYPKEKLIGRSAVQYGMEERQFRDGYNDYISVDGEKYFGCSLETEKYYIYIVVPVEELTRDRGAVALASAGVSLLCLAVIFLLLTLSRGNGPVKAQENSRADGPMIDVVMPDGRTKKTEPAASRWANIAVGWRDKTPEQQILSVIKGLLSIFALLICLAVLFEDRFFDSNSIFLYVLKGRWEKGVNIFAMTACVMVLCVTAVITMALRRLLQLLSQTFDARGETVCRLFSSFLKYISVIAAMYYCFALFGVDTATLLASAGILSLVIGLGAKTLVSDILAGLFIIFEGEFRVGDIVTVGDWRGTVLEIGVRTTKIEDPSKNIKIISNSDVNGVINMTRRYSFASCDVGIEYGESLERVETILEKELPRIKHRLPSIQEGPFYKGVVSLGDNSVNIRIMAQCAEGDRVQLGRDLNREMKLLFDKYDINIPFPQIVLNHPIEYKQATEQEKRHADAFAKKQSQMAKDLELEPEEER